jgi:hypothetical protein
MKKQTLFAFVGAVATATAIACSQAPAPPTSPGASDPVSAALGPDDSSLKVGAPTLVSPAGGVEIEDLDPTFVINNVTARFASTVGLSYVFQVVDAEGRIVHTSAPVPAGSGGRTSYELPVDLENDEAHTWRAWAVYQGQRGPRSNTGSFKTLSRFGVSCAHLGEPVAIIACRFEQHDGESGMDHEELIQFMKEVAFDLNRAIFSDKGGYGVLIKTEGNNCLGYSCDIICEGNGGDQNQFDILQDERIPQWSEVGDGIVVRQCEIIK